MRRIIKLLLVIILGIPLTAQINFSGKADLLLYGNISNSSNYSSLMNPLNISEIKDLGFSTSILSKFKGGDDKVSFSAWIALKGYPIGLALLSSSNGNPLQESGVMELSKTIGDTILSLELMRFSTSINLVDNITLEIGRQNMQTAYGYGWNPTSFANPIKDPLDPNGELRGIDAISFKFNFDETINLKIFGILPRDLFSTGLDYEEIKAGAEMAIIYPRVEIKISGIYDYDQSVGSDSYTSAVGLAFMADLWGLEFYGEGALRVGSRNYFTDGSATLFRKEAILPSLLIGLEYTFKSGTSILLEYFYNGEGYNKLESSNFKNTLILLGAPTADLYDIYTPGYFARHYIMLNFIQSFYDINLDISLNTIFSPDSGSLIVQPALSYSFTKDFDIKLFYIGMYELYRDYFNESSAQAVQHMIQAVLTYNF